MRSVVWIAIAVAAAQLVGCAPGGAAASRPTIVVTTNILGDVVGEMVADQARVVTLMPPDSDPHSFEISAAEAATIFSADVLVANGLGLEEGLAHHLDSALADGVPVVTADQFFEPLDYSSGETEGAADPHFWTDPRRMIGVVDGLEGVFAEIEGIDRGALAESTEAYRSKLVQLDESLEKSFGLIPEERRALVTNHHVFGYLAARFDFEIIGAVIPSGTTLAAPSASDLDELVSAIHSAGVTTIFADSAQPDRLIEVLAEEADTRVSVVALYSESLTASGGGAETYLDLMRSNERSITSGLSP